MDFQDYANEVLWGRLGRLCVGLVFLLSTLLATFALVKSVPILTVLLLWIGPPVLYQVVTLLAAFILWFITTNHDDTNIIM